MVQWQFAHRPHAAFLLYKIFKGRSMMVENKYMQVEKELNEAKVELNEDKVENANMLDQLSRGKVDEQNIKELKRVNNELRKQLADLQRQGLEEKLKGSHDRANELQ